MADHDASGPSDGPVDPRVDRFRPLSNALGRALAAVGVLAVLAVLAPSPVGRWAGIALVATLVVVPMLRVVWLVVRWFRRGDHRYAWVGVGVLAVITTGAVAGLL